MLKKLLFFFLPLLFIVAILFAQQSNFYLIDSITADKLNPADKTILDSILPIYHNTKQDTAQIKLLDFLTDKISDETLWVKYNDLEYEKSKKALSNINLLNKKEIILYNKYLNRSLEGKAIRYEQIGDISKAIELYNKSLEIAEQIGDREYVASNFIALGEVYQDQHDTAKALEYFQKGLKISEGIQDKENMASALNDIGSIYQGQGKIKNALECFQKSLEINENLKDQTGIAESFGCIGSIYHLQGDNNKAIEYFQRSLKICDDEGSQSNVAFYLDSIGEIYLQQKDFENALIYGQRSLNISQEIGFPKNIEDATKLLYKVYREQNNWKDAFKMYDLCIKMRNDESQKVAIKEEQKYEFAKKEVVMKAEQEKQIAIEEADKKRQQIFLWLIASIGIGAVVIAFIIFRSLRATRKQKQIIEVQKNEVEKQKQLVEDHQKEIVDSITYAKRLQEAILPPLDFVKKHLPDSFIFYKPKDIVAGDFYWMELMDNIIFIAAADCTGHGVPGAMVSVVCSNALNRTVKEFGLRDTGKILDKVTDLVLETFEKSDADVKDGMDISILVINKISNQIQWSGANNPLWYIQNGEVNELPPNKQPIGKHENRKPFITHNITYKPNTTFYLFTDGYADQFGGEKGKKFKYRQLEERLLAISGKAMDQQKNILEKTFDEWKGNLEQVDDVCIIGIRING